MTIRSKIIFITIPLIITPLALTLLVGTFSARNGITNVATRLLTFKSKMIISYMENQWLLLTGNNLDGNPDFVTASKESIAAYNRTLIENEHETIFVIDREKALVMKTGSVDLSEESLNGIYEKIIDGQEGWIEFETDDTLFISDVSSFAPFGWTVVNAVEKDFFYSAVNKILYRSFVITLISLILSLFLLVLFSNYLSQPVHKIVDVIRWIIESNDLSQDVGVYYDDEIGRLGHYFNIMTKKLMLADQQIKRYALRAVISKRNESKIRNIFQKYVPKEVIDKFYMEPESMLQGDSRVLGILFSDIRRFTDFSEKLPPHEVVESLNHYFEYMVDIILRYNGIVDKYIGDAIMAFFGAPVHHVNDALEATLAGLDMLTSLKLFNDWQIENGRIPFHIGIGINYGFVTVGNIGTDKKMDYTIIGDMVNLASRLEALTKKYNENILISESVHMKIYDDLPCRLIDKVVVKGKSDVSPVYTVRKTLSGKEITAWDIHEKAMTLYYLRDFEEALHLFTKIPQFLPEDHCSVLYANRCRNYIKDPPSADWKGATVLDSK